MSTLRLGIAALAIACTAGVAVAQTTAPADSTTPPANTTTTAPAEKMATPPANTATDDAKTAPAIKNDANAPLPGANSFTENQARERIIKAGYQDVGQLKKDDQGIWRGQAKKGDQQVGVALDYRGNIVQQ